jgi:opacity protein-like surface antigen
MYQSVVRPRSGAILAVSVLVAAPAAMAATASQPSAEEPELQLGPADSVAVEEGYSFDILAPSIPPAAAPAAALAPYYDNNASGMYFRLGAGLITSTDSDGPGEEINFDEGYMLSAAIGHRFAGKPDNLAFDLELEGVWSDQDTDEDGPIQSVSDVTVLGLLVNGLADYRIAQSFSLYGGAGIGASMMDIGTESDALNDFNDEDGPFLTWQAKAGVKFLMAGGGAFNFGYRFFNVDDVEIDDDIGGADFELQTEQHGLELGYTFGAGAGH